MPEFKVEMNQWYNCRLVVDGEPGFWHSMAGVLFSMDMKWMATLVEPRIVTKPDPASYTIFQLTQVATVQEVRDAS